LSVTTRGLDRLDIFVDAHPHGSVPLRKGSSVLGMPKTWSTAELVGYQNDELRQRRRLHRT
ncbi:MAG: hypothetical protein M3Q08_19045, partial [Pseudomonadota bacterium]|nr:hypothetical protein [Pseudomonadota bacterium]